VSVALVGASLLTTLVLQALLALGFALVVRRRLRHRPQLALPAPAAEVVLCLRGADPSLPAALAALAAQSYPGPWRLQVVVDSRQDQAWTIAAAEIAALEATGRARWQGARLIPLATRPEGGSLKSASLRQAFGELDGATVVVALVDADAVVPEEWLTALVAGCGQKGIGAVSGNRWYAPELGSGPGLVRSIWNSAALVLMTLLQIPWGGCLAVRRSLVDAGDWSAVLATSFGEDTSLLEPLVRSGLRYEFRPELLIVDRDDSINLRSLQRWLSRQLFSLRLHHPAWPLVALHGLGTWALVFSALALAALELLKGQPARAVTLLAALLLYELGCVALLLVIKEESRRALFPLGSALVQPQLKQALRLLCWVPVAQWLYGVASLKACLARRVEWRGVYYRLKGRGVEQLKPMD